MPNYFKTYVIPKYANRTLNKFIPTYVRFKDHGNDVSNYYTMETTILPLYLSIDHVNVVEISNKIFQVLSRSFTKEWPEKL